jgi:hypothetical protein
MYRQPLQRQKEYVPPKLQHLSMPSYTSQKTGILIFTAKVPQI